MAGADSVEVYSLPGLKKIATVPVGKGAGTIVFTPDGKIRGDGIDDIAPFLIDGQFNGATSEANWTKAYIGMHSVEYVGIYCQRAICGNWTLMGVTGGFWIWPDVLAESENAGAQIELEQPVLT